MTTGAAKRLAKIAAALALLTLALASSAFAAPSFDTTVADFAAGTGSGTYVGEAGDGELLLAPELGTEFSGAALTSGWAAAPWGKGGASTVAGGKVSVDGALVRPDAFYGPGRAVDFVATFAAAPYQNVGVGQTFNEHMWAVFGTGGDGALRARTNDDGAIRDTLLPPSLRGSPHTYRMEWTASEVVFSVDGIVVARHFVTIDAALRPMVSDYEVGGASLVVDWLRMSRYGPLGTFVSRVFDAGTGGWGAISWTANDPTGTGLAISVRTGDTPTPDASWTPFVAISASGAAIGSSSRFAQYRAELKTPQPFTPVLYDVSLTPGSAPTVALTTKPAEIINATTAAFGFTGPPGSRFECQLDSGGYQPCTSPQEYSGVLAGGHTFQVRAVDATGSTGPATAYAWTIDLVGPFVELRNQPGTFSAVSNVSFMFTATEDGSTFECELDGAGFAPCVSPRDYVGLAERAHTFQVRATDRAGNVGPARQHSWTVDLTAPILTLSGRPDAVTNATTASFVFSASEPIFKFECRVDAGAWELCSSPKNYAALADGPHTFQLIATDRAGLTSAATYSWAIVNGAPTVTLSAKPANPSAQASASFEFTSSEGGSSFECKLDLGVYRPCTSSATYAGLADGAHTFSVRATDADGNAGPELEYTWTVDTQAPTILFTLKPPNPSNSTTADFTVALSEPVVRFECMRDALGWGLCDPGPKMLVAFGEGVHAFSGRATDAAGNAGPITSYTWTVDLTAPAAAITSKPADPTTETAATFEFASPETGPTFQCRLDAAGYAPCVSPTSYSGLAGGAHTFSVRATDAAGNTGLEAAYTWTVQAPVDEKMAPPPAAPAPGLVAAYSFDSGTGGTAADASGKGNHGGLMGPSWTTAGRYGGALSFDGIDDAVVVADSDSLDFTNAMTLEAWVNRDDVAATWQTLLLKEQAGSLVYALYADTDRSTPSAHVFVGADTNTFGQAQVLPGTWTHITLTFDGSFLRLYLNGVESASRWAPGPMPVSDGALWIGGNSLWGEWFSGRVDDVRVYDRALSPSEIQLDMDTPVSG